MNSHPDCRDENKKLRQKVNNEVRSRQEENRREEEKMMQEWAMFKKCGKKEGVFWPKGGQGLPVE